MLKMNQILKRLFMNELLQHEEWMYLADPVPGHFVNHGGIMQQTLTPDYD